MKFPIRIVIMSLSALFLATGCASVISKSVLDKVDRNVTFQSLKANPDQFTGRVVVFGGQILATTAKQSETWVEVLQKPLDSSDKPEDTDVSYGRFLILFQGFADPAIYHSGRKITVAGEVQGKKVLPLNQIEYTYPVIIPREHHILRPEDGPRYRGSLPIGISIGIGGVFH